MKVYNERESCSGCTACISVCPKNAIEMIADNEGFLYPQINNDLCISCNLCRKVCPFKHENMKSKSEENINLNMDKEKVNERGKEIQFAGQLYFAAKHKNNEVIFSSSSGGIFTALSDYILQKEGSIYGAAFDENFIVKHMKATNKLDRDEFKGSKYVQSDLKDIFKQIKNELKSEKYVMFTGTPCQNAGLQNYLSKTNTDYTRLYMCDFICHGTPSPLIWKDYISHLESKFNDKLISFSFRNKENGWKDMKVSAKFIKENRSKECNNKYSFLNLFSSLMIVRPSCFNCQFTSYNRRADITIADFWNIGNIKPDFDDDKGVSSVIVNTDKGLSWFGEIKSNLRYESCNKEDCWQPHLEYPAVMPSNRKVFWNEYNDKGIAYIVDKYGKGTLSSNMKKKLTPIIRKLGLYVLAGKVYKIIFSRK
ncbi:MAG: Coenzyme F420 hydrogenase/dehydrogenase, beta subunit C-terminal domain [Clostridium beijerinckii]